MVAADAGSIGLEGVVGDDHTRVCGEGAPTGDGESVQGGQLNGGGGLAVADVSSKYAVAFVRVVQRSCEVSGENRRVGVVEEDPLIQLGLITDDASGHGCQGGGE